MRKANKHKRPPAQDDARANGENVQPALVNSAVASAADPLPEGNWREAVESIRNNQKDLAGNAHPVVRRDMELFAREFERRARAMPFVRFVANGEPLPVEIGNVDKLQALDGSGTWYMFPTSENMRLSEGNDPEDPTQGQEAQGGPLHSITGRGEKYAGGNVETDTVADEYKDPQADGKGSQTGGTGIQRARLGDDAAYGAAVENSANYSEDGRLRPLRPGTVIEQVKGTHDDEPGIIRRTTDVSKLHRDDGMFRVVKDREAPKAPTPNINRSDHQDSDAKAKPTVVDTRFADSMKEGQKTATDAAAAGAVTAGNSAADIEADSPGILGGFDGKQSEDASEGTMRDTEQPTVERLTPGVDPYRIDSRHPHGQEVNEFIDDHGVPRSTGATRTDFEAVHRDADSNKAGRELVRQKSDEATPQTAGGVLVGSANAKTEDGESKSTDTEKRETKAASKPRRTAAKKGGVKITKVGKGKASTSKPATKPEKMPDSASHQEQKDAEPGVVKGDDGTPTKNNPPADEADEA